MTKPRDPVTIENALMRVLGELTVEHAAAVTGRAESYLRALSDPDKREHLTVRDLELLDLEHHARHGEGFPLFQALGRRLETAKAERFADAAAIGRHAIDVAKEHGEACAALIEAAIGGADPRLLETALRETVEANRATEATIATIRDLIARTRDGPAAAQPP